MRPLIATVLVLAAGANLAWGQTRCQRALQQANTLPLLMGAPTVECEINGDYKPRQCNPSARTCYCVTTNGDSIPNTWWSLLPSDLNAIPKDCVAERQKYSGSNSFFQFTTASPTGLLKLGSCPDTSNMGPCLTAARMNNCRLDSDCFGALKCCSMPCGQTCQTPVNSGFVATTQSPFGTVAGSCPDVNSVGGICGNFCRQDSDCRNFGNAKCCSNGCGYTCVQPVFNVQPTGLPNPNDPCSGNPCPFGQTCTPVIVNCFVPPCPAMYQCTGGSGGTTCTDPNSRFDQCNGNPSCQENCYSPLQTMMCPAMCVPGCVCSPGFVRQTASASSACVSRSMCTYGVQPSSQQPQVVTQAVVTIVGTPTNPNLRGTLTFSQTNGAGPVLIVGSLQGLTPGQHGFHVHEFGDLGNNCVSAGAHFNPANQLHNGPSDSTRHVGDLGNILAPTGGNTAIYLQDQLVSLNGRNSIVGRAVVIHEKPDDLGKGGNDESRKTGNAGTRLACGVIGVKAVQSS